MAKYYGVACGGCGRNLSISRCPSETAFPEFDLGTTEIVWKCSVCGFESRYQQGCLIVFDEPQGSAFIAPPPEHFHPAM